MSDFFLASLLVEVAVLKVRGKERLEKCSVGSGQGRDGPGASCVEREGREGGSVEG
jgi:hypothetical protein